MRAPSRSVRSLAVLGLVTALLATRASAETVVVPCDRDATLYEHERGNRANGAGTHLFAGRTHDGTLRRGLVHFDVAAHLPPDAVVESVTLRLRVSRTVVRRRDVSVHRVLADWGEAGSVATGQEGRGGSAHQGDATWLYRRFASRSWSEPGGDFVPQPSAVLEVDRASFYDWSGPGLASDVRAWLDGSAPNHGWLVRGDETREPSTTKRFDTRENGTAVNRPVLIVEYTAAEDQVCRAGTVNRGVSEAPSDVLFLNGSKGDGSRTVTLPPGEPIQVTLARPPAGPEVAPFVLYLFAGAPHPSSVTPQPGGLGTMCFSSPISGGAPDLRKVWNNLGREGRLGEPDFPSSPAPSILVNAAAGARRAALVTLQGLMLDDGSAADFPASVTNAIVLRVID